MISALHLPKPEQAELKANSVDPYVVVQIFGVPRDCDEVRTKTVYHNCKLILIKRMKNRKDYFLFLR